MPHNFLMPKRKKIQLFGKTNLEKNTKKNFIVNNNNNIIRAQYLSSK